MKNNAIMPAITFRFPEARIQMVWPEVVALGCGEIVITKAIKQAEKKNSVLLKTQTLQVGKYVTCKIESTQEIMNYVREMRRMYKPNLYLCHLST